MRGFTFIEMIVVVGIVALLSIVMGDSVLMFFKAEESTSSQSNSITAAQGAFDAIVKNLREADYGADGSYPIVSMATSSLTFFSDSGNGGAAQRITFKVFRTSLLESIVNPSGTPPAYPVVSSSITIADNVQNFSQNKALFHYFDSAGNEITDFSQVTAVTSVLVTLPVTSDIKRFPTHQFQSSVTLRNLRSN